MHHTPSMSWTKNAYLIRRASWIHRYMYADHWCQAHAATMTLFFFSSYIVRRMCLCSHRLEEQTDRTWKELVIADQASLFDLRWTSWKLLVKLYNTFFCLKANNFRKCFPVCTCNFLHNNWPPQLSICLCTLGHHSLALKSSQNFTETHGQRNEQN